jgi:hypothetical protein
MCQPSVITLHSYLVESEIIHTCLDYLPKQISNPKPRVGTFVAYSLYNILVDKISVTAVVIGQFPVAPVVGRFALLANVVSIVDPTLQRLVISPT